MRGPPPQSMQTIFAESMKGKPLCNKTKYTESDGIEINCREIEDRSLAGHYVCNDKYDCNNPQTCSKAWDARDSSGKKYYGYCSYVPDA